jgi:FkbM family methyltransferase
MSYRLIKGLDRSTRIIQNLLGPKATQYIQAKLGSNGTRSVRELLGRSPRHRAQIFCNKEVCGNGDASWVICPDQLTSEGIIYSVGVGNDITFDLGLIERFGVQVFAFDPTPGSVAWVKSKNLPEKFHFIEYGIADFDGFTEFHNFDGIQFTLCQVANSRSSIKLPVRRLKTIMNELGHNKISLLKIDVEGGEYSIIKDILNSAIDINQLLIEFHHWLPAFSSSQTKHAVALLNNEGYKIFNISEIGREYSFIRI